MPINKVPICPVVTHQFLDDPPDQGGSDPFVVGDLTTGELARFVKAKVYARVCQSPTGPEDDDTPASRVIDVDQTFAIDVYWKLTGPLVPAFCGNWAAKISFESQGPDDWDLEIVTSCQIPFGCAEPKQNRNERTYHARYTVPANTVKTEDDGTAYELNLSLVLMSACDQKPLELIGFVPLEDILFYSS